MKVMVMGASGMLGHVLVRVLASRFETAGTVRGRAEDWAGYEALTGGQLIGGVSAEDFDSVVRAFALYRPKAVINAVGLIKQRPEARDPLAALLVNAVFPHRLAGLCQSAGARLIHVGTDCVFSGKKGAYVEEDVPDAKDLYGRTKLLGEVTGPGCLTLRTSLIGLELRTSAGLIEWFLGQKNGRVSGYTRAVFSGLTTTVFANLVADVLENRPDLVGLRHVSSDPIDKYTLLGLVNDALGLSIEIQPDESVVLDRSLNSDTFRRETSFTPPSWPGMISGLANEWREGRRGGHADR